jgi:hypothetical protein
MRVQQQNQRLRLRIEEAELRQLLAGEVVLNTICWPGRRETQTIELADRLDWQDQPNGWRMRLPDAEVRELAARLPSREGLHWTLPVPQAEPLRILFDVDVRDSARRRYPRRSSSSE